MADLNGMGLSEATRASLQRCLLRAEAEIIVVRDTAEIRECWLILELARGVLCLSDRMREVIKRG